MIIKHIKSSLTVDKIKRDNLKYEKDITRARLGMVVDSPPGKRMLLNFLKTEKLN